LGSTGFIGLWFSSCTDSNCRNVLVKSTPGSLDEDEDDEAVAADDEAEAVGVAAWSICISETDTSLTS
jgi:hypothetical protein